mgnify:CR=1 FL=1
MYENIAYPLSSFPSQGKWEQIPESYIEYQKLLDERIKNQKREFEEKMRENQEREFRNFWRRFDPFFDDRPPLDVEFEEYDDDYPFNVFGLKKSASQEDMKTAYRKAVRATHPDKTGEDSEDEFREVQEAYEYYQMII